MMVSTAVPDRILPMLASSGGLPEEDARYAFEFKWDGVRAIVHCNQGKVRIDSRRLQDITTLFPEIQALGASLPGRQAILDGEVVAISEESGRPDFGEIQSRLNIEDAARVKRLQHEVPVSFLAFDLLYLDGESLLREHYLDRQARLRELSFEGPAWATPVAQIGGGNEALNASRSMGIEGVVAKRIDSLYEPGRRTNAWIKVKSALRQEFVVAGYTRGHGERVSTLGSLLLGYWDADGRLAYAGRVGTGFDEATLKALRESLQKVRRDRSPFRDSVEDEAHALFVEPRIVVDVEFSEWTHHKHVRAPRFKGFRFDKHPSEVVLEEPVRELQEAATHA